jgi:hypothetical protein
MNRDGGVPLRSDVPYPAKIWKRRVPADAKVLAVDAIDTLPTHR